MKQYWSDIKALFLLLSILLFVLAIDIGAVIWYDVHVNRFLEKQSYVEHADAGIIFFGDYEEDEMALGPDSKSRATVAIDLFKQNKIDDVVCVGGYDYRHWRGKPNLMKLFLIAHGIPANKIIYDSLSFNTITNWMEAGKIIEKENFDTVIAISAPLHIYRIAHMISRDHVFYKSYTYKLHGFRDYWVIYKDVHHEWISMFLSFALRDEVRNRLVYFVRTVMNVVNNVL